VRREAGDAFDMSVPTARQILFSPRAKKVLERALREAVRLRDNHIGTEHVLLRILHNQDGTSVGMLARLGEVPKRLEDRLFELR
jgi:ATP-dependent Clp protease ATP-binding subunit ClpC